MIVDADETQELAVKAKLLPEGRQIMHRQTAKADGNSQSRYFPKEFRIAVENTWR